MAGHHCTGATSATLPVHFSALLLLNNVLLPGLGTDEYAARLRRVGDSVGRNGHTACLQAQLEPPRRVTGVRLPELHVGRSAAAATSPAAVPRSVAAAAVIKVAALAVAAAAATVVAAAVAASSPVIKAAASVVEATAGSVGNTIPQSAIASAAAPVRRYFTAGKPQTAGLAEATGARTQR